MDATPPFQEWPLVGDRAPGPSAMIPITATLGQLRTFHSELLSTADTVSIYIKLRKRHQTSALSEQISARLSPLKTYSSASLGKAIWSWQE